MFAWVAEGRGRVSARRPRCFSLLRQRKVPKRKATPLGVSLRFAAGNLRCSRVRRCRRTRCALAALRSNNCGKSDHEAWACCAAPARLTRCASRHVQRDEKSNSGHRCARPGCTGVLGDFQTLSRCWGRLPCWLSPPTLLLLRLKPAPGRRSGRFGKVEFRRVKWRRVRQPIASHPVAPNTEGRAQRWPVWTSTPFWMRLGRGAGGVAAAPQDAAAS